jgi:hypothetical protein
MKRTLVEKYALAVCFMALCFVVITSGIAIYDFIGIINPEFTISPYEYERHQSNDLFIKNISKDKVPVTDDEITRLRQAGYRTALRIEKHKEIQALTEILILIVLAIITFIVHWFIGKRARCSMDPSILHEDRQIE